MLFLARGMGIGALMKNSIKAGRKAGNDPYLNSLGLLPSGPDPVGERNVRASLPKGLFVPSPPQMQEQTDKISRLLPV